MHQVEFKPAPLCLVIRCRINLKPGLHLSVFAENRRERILNMISVNGH